MQLPYIPIFFKRVCLIGLWFLPLFLYFMKLRYLEVARPKLNIVGICFSLTLLLNIY
jgi:hypothetical protein